MVLRARALLSRVIQLEFLHCLHCLLLRVHHKHLGSLLSLESKMFFLLIFFFSYSSKDFFLKEIDDTKEKGGRKNKKALCLSQRLSIRSLLSSSSKFLKSSLNTHGLWRGQQGLFTIQYPLRLDARSLSLDGSLTGSTGSSWVLLAGLANVAFAETLGDDDALLADGRLALVALHQGLAVPVALFTNGSTAVFLAAAVANYSRAAIVDG